MRNIILVFACLLLTFSVIAQDPAHPVKLTNEQFLLMDQARQFLASNQNVVFNLPCDQVPGWDANLNPGQSAVFGEDRFKNKEHALAFNFGNQGLQAKPGNYFEGDFTISVWVNIESVSKWSRIIDFGIGPNNSNIVFSNSASMSGIPGLAIYRGEGSDITQLRGTEPNRLKEGQWYHLAATLQGTTTRLYINGIEVQKAENFYKPGNISRPVCLIGKSNFEGESNFYGRMDDLRIYDIALSDIHIKLLANWSFETDMKAGDPDTAGTKTPEAPGQGGTPVPTTTGQVTPTENPAVSPDLSAQSGSAKDPMKSGNGNSSSQPAPAPKPNNGTDPSNNNKGTTAGKSGEGNDTTSIPNKVVPLKCSKTEYKRLELTDVLQKPDGLANANALLSKEGEACWRLKGDLGGIWLYKDANATDKWEHKMVITGRNSDPVAAGNELGQQGWEMTHYFAAGAIFSRPADPAARQKWECTVLATPDYATNEKDLAANREEVESMLNEMGAKGWDIVAIIRNKHFFKKPAGSTETWEYLITTAQSSDGAASSSTMLGLLGWSFGAIPLQMNSVNFRSPTIYKLAMGPTVNQKIFCSYLINRMGVVGGNKDVYGDIARTVNAYTKEGWTYESPVDGLGEKFGLLFSSRRSCLADAGGFLLGVYDCPESETASFISQQFFLFTAKLPGIVQVSRSSKIMKLIEEENELSASGLVIGETATAARIIPEEISARFADAGNGLVKATIQGKKGSRTFDFKIDNLSSSAMIARFQEMVDYARQVK